MLDGPDSTLGGIVTEITLSVPAISIAGGTDQIQRTILGERILGPAPRAVQPGTPHAATSARTGPVTS